MSMLLHADPTAKINVCAPSNAAVDEILSRVAKKGISEDETEEELARKLLRIGALSPS